MTEQADNWCDHCGRTHSRIVTWEGKDTPAETFRALKHGPVGMAPVEETNVGVREDSTMSFRDWRGHVVRVHPGDRIEITEAGWARKEVGDADD